MPGAPLRARVAILLMLASLAACTREPRAAPTALRLVDLYRPEAVQARVVSPAPERTEWRFDAPPAAAPAGPPAKPAAAHLGWQAGPGVAQLRVRDGLLTGRATTSFPLLHVEWPGAVGNLDTVHEVQVRLRVSAGKTIGVDGRGGESLDLAGVIAYSQDFPWDTTAPLADGGELQTVTLRPPRPIWARDVRHLLLRPTDAAGGEFAIQSVRLVTRREHLAGIPSGVGWQGLSQVYRETLVARAPEVLRFELEVPPRALLDLGVGTVEDGPVQFVVRVRPPGSEAAKPLTLLARTVTTAHRWEPLAVDLSRHAGERIALELALVAEGRGALGFWGSPVVRPRVAAATAATEPAGEPAPPQGVILVWADTTRRDHLSAYGYRRDTTPVLARLAREGTRFDSCVSQATWTKVSTPSLLTALYPSTHGVTDFSHRLPASYTTLAEVLRAGGFATVSMSSILFTGQFTNLHQGFEELHEDTSLPDRESSKTARVYVDRLLPWLERHREVPFFALLHVADPHDPYEPAPPYATLWNDPAGKEEHARQSREVRQRIGDPLLRAFGMPTRAELAAAGFDPERYVEYDRGWYDGSLRGMDAELGRLVERLRELGLERKTLIVFAADHGEEFLDHGRMFHGQSTYAELADVPLIFWRPGAVPAGKVVGETVETIDVMPTILEAVGLPVPPEAQGRSLAALLGSAGAKPWRSRPAFIEKNLTPEAVGPPPPRDTESFAIIDGGWKLIHNTKRPRGGPEIELYEVRSDPDDQRDVAAAHPQVVARLSAQLAAWRAKALAARRPLETSAADLKPEELERLRSLGYVQ
jgi:arylsulfatase A-like enzyme